MKLQIYGDYAFEFLVITILFSLSLVLILPFPLMMVGICGYFQSDIHERRLIDIFKHIKENIKIIILYSIFQLVILLVPCLNIYYYNTHPELINEVIYTISYVILILGVICMVSAPTIIINMKVNLRQLIFNSFILLFSNIKNALITIILIALIVLLVIYFPYVIILTFYFILLITTKLMGENLSIIKAKR